MLRFVVIVAALITALSASEHTPANNGLPLVKADYEMCAQVEGPSLLRSPNDRMDYHAGQHFNDKGTA